MEQLRQGVTSGWSEGEYEAAVNALKRTTAALREAMAQRDDELKRTGDQHSSKDMAISAFARARDAAFREVARLEALRPASG